MKIGIISDAWHPQINGVVRTLSQTEKELCKSGHEVHIIAPHMFPNLPCPTYPEIRLAYHISDRLQSLLLKLRPEAIHIATEGPLGFAARRECIRLGLPFTTAYHTRFPEYLKAKMGIPRSVSYAVLKRFHDRSQRVMVATPSMQAKLEKRGFQHIVQWTRGVDVDLFRPQNKDFLNLPRPIFLNVGRVSVEKNLEAFFNLDLPGSKLVVGEGPELERYMAEYSDVHFAGKKVGEELSRYYAAADAFVFPSLTDTFGLVVLEALASGLPVAAFPVTGPLDIIGNAHVGCLNHSLKVAALNALRISPGDCRMFALKRSWSVSSQQFLTNLFPFEWKVSLGSTGLEHKHSSRLVYRKKVEAESLSI